MYTSDKICEREGAQQIITEMKRGNTVARKN